MNDHNSYADHRREEMEYEMDRLDQLKYRNRPFWQDMLIVFAMFAICFFGLFDLISYVHH